MLAFTIPYRKGLKLATITCLPFSAISTKTLV